MDGTGADEAPQADKPAEPAAHPATPATSPKPTTEPEQRPEQQPEHPEREAPTEAEPDGAEHVPTPAVLGRRRPTEVVLPSATPTWTSQTGDEPMFDEDGVFNPEIIDSVAKNVVASWCRTATPDDLMALRQSKPTIPGELDRALLLDLSGRAGVYDIDDASRHEVRDRFWYHVGRVRLT